MFSLIFFFAFPFLLWKSEAKYSDRKSQRRLA